MKPIKDLYGDHARVTVQDMNRIQLDTATRNGSSTRLVFSREQSKRLRKALKAAEAEA